MIIEEKDHFGLFTKPKFHEMRAGIGSENTGLYKKYVPTPMNLDFIVEYFKFEERKRLGFSSPYLTKNPYENAFADYVEELENKYRGLPNSTAHARLIADLEVKHSLALASLK